MQRSVIFADKCPYFTKWSNLQRVNCTTPTFILLHFGQINQDLDSLQPSMSKREALSSCHSALSL